MERQLKVLIVDDEAVVGARLKPALEKEGYHVETFTESPPAKKRLEECEFDVVVTDIRMADIDGMALLQFIREKWPGTKVIIISGFASVDVAREAFQTGAVDVIAKPFKISQLKDLIGRVSSEGHRPNG
jgi:DNA-binding NtrC family response regulator